MNGNIEESVEGMKVIKVFNHEQQAFDEFEETNESFRKAATNANFFSGIMGPCSTGINNASYATIALVGGLLALTGSLDIGTFFTFLSYSKQFTQPINQIANQMNTVFSALAGAERVFEIMDMSPEIDNGTVTLSEEKRLTAKSGFGLTGIRKFLLRARLYLRTLTLATFPKSRCLRILTFMQSRVKRLLL